jgi:hypothetical protein
MIPVILINVYFVNRATKLANINQMKWCITHDYETNVLSQEEKNLILSINTSLFGF